MPDTPVDVNHPYGLLRRWQPPELLPQSGADLIILSHTLTCSNTHDTLARIREVNHTVPVIVFSADPAVGATIVQDDITSFVENPFLYKGLDEMLAKMVSA